MASKLLLLLCALAVSSDLVTALPSLESVTSTPRGGMRHTQRPPSKDPVGPFVMQEMIMAETRTQPTTSFITESLSGMTVALATIPSSIAYAGIAGLDPLVGIWSSAILGAVSAVTGMRPGVIAGAAGVVAVPLAKIVSEHGKQYMAPTILLASLMELAFALAKGGKLIDLVSDAVMSGFLNGLGGLLLKSQMKVFLTHGKSGALSFLPKNELVAASTVTAMTTALCLILPKLLPGQGFPTALIAIVASTVVAHKYNLPVVCLSVGDGSTDGKWYDALPSFSGLPKGEFSIFSPKTLRLVAPTAFSIAVICVLETLLAVKVIDETGDEGTATSPDETTIAGYDVNDKSCAAMAFGNIASAMFGGFGGCGLIPHTLLNVQSGGKGVVSVLSFAAVVAICIVFTSSLINKVPMASLAGVLILVGIRTIQWKSSFEVIVAAWTSFRKAVSVRGRDSTAVKATAALLALLVSSFVCFYVDMGSGIILGVLLDKGLPLLIQ